MCAKKWPKWFVRTRFNVELADANADANADAYDELMDAGNFIAGQHCLIFIQSICEK